MCPRLGEGLSGQGAWSQGSTLLPSVQSSGQPVNAREAWPFCPCSGEVFLGLRVAAQSGRPERESQAFRPPTVLALQGGPGFGRHRGPRRWRGGADSHAERRHAKEDCSMNIEESGEMSTTFY